MLQAARDHKAGTPNRQIVLSSYTPKSDPMTDDPGVSATTSRERLY
ncbi:MAG TPA: hypothetical protein VN887_00100 [Candidatus Angelobacter sp.]|nr:hypothetical protein [Candidatus Angelobacter sp.]